MIRHSFDARLSAPAEIQQRSHFLKRLKHQNVQTLRRLSRSVSVSSAKKADEGRAVSVKVDLQTTDSAGLGVESVVLSTSKRSQPLQVVGTQFPASPPSEKGSSASSKTPLSSVSTSLGR